MYNNKGKGKLQGKTHTHRRALIKSQVTELIRNQKIKTTPSKAKVLKSEFDKLVTKAKKDTPHSKNQVISFFGNNERAVERLYSIVESKLGDRNSGYTRVIKTLPRKGDGAAQCYVMLVNAEAPEKKSRIAGVLERQEKKKEEKSVSGRVKKAVGASNSKSKKSDKKSETKESKK